MRSCYPGGGFFPSRSSLPEQQIKKHPTGTADSGGGWCRCRWRFTMKRLRRRRRSRRGTAELLHKRDRLRRSNGKLCDRKKKNHKLPSGKQLTSSHQTCPQTQGQEDPESKMQSLSFFQFSCIFWLKPTTLVWTTSRWKLAQPILFFI